VSSLRLASVNLFSGRSLRDGLVDHDRVGTALAELDAHVLALQEVDRFQPRSGRVDQAVLAAEATGAREYRFVPLVEGTPGVPGWRPGARHPEPVDVHPDGPSYGIALASRHPVRSWHVLHLDPPPGRWPIPLPTRPPRLLWLSDEPRAVLAAVLDRPRITVACTHLSFVPGVNARQLRRARRWLTDLPDAGDRPIVLLGDLNLPGGLPGLLTGWTPLVSAPTYPAPAPRAQIDHALASPGWPSDGRAGGAGRVVELPFSDHRAVLVDLPVPAG
jgi:endonuclease/exonuclease/phosphatase family metal-dependent hydrolase